MYTSNGRSRLPRAAQYCVDSVPQEQCGSGVGSGSRRARHKAYHEKALKPSDLKLVTQCLYPVPSQLSACLILYEHSISGSLLWVLIPLMAPV